MQSIVIPVVGNGRRCLLDQLIGNGGIFTVALFVAFLGKGLLLGQQLFTITAVISAIAGALYYPQAGIINPEEMAPIASIYLAVWVAIGGRGRLYGAVIGAAFVSLLSTWFTGGQAPDIPLGFYTIKWVDWWQVLLGVSFVLVTLFAPKGIGGLFDLWTNRRAPQRHGAPLGPDDSALREKEATE